MIGQTISHYQILEKLGSGGMGAVYKARDLKLDRFVALKFLNRDLLVDEEARKRFKNEAKAISALDHPNIATVFEIDEIDDSFFISMSYYPGKNLRDLLSSGALSINEACSIGSQIARGLSAAHAAGVIHRDIKPANILITDSGAVKIVDFGLSKVLRYSKITRQDTIMGTAAYMSPEQIRGDTVDHRSDIFSAGVLLYEMLAGKGPFEGEAEISLFYSILEENPTPLHLLRPEIPAQLEQAVNKAMSKDVTQRYQFASDLEADLNAVIGEAPEIRAGPKSQHVFSSSRRAVTLLGSILILALALSLFFIFRSSEGPNHNLTSIAVMPFSFQGDEDWSWLSKAVADLVSTDLTQNSPLRVLGARQQTNIIRHLGFQDSTLSEEQALEVAREAGVKSVLLGSVKKSGETIHLNARVLAANTGRSVTGLGPFENTLDKFYDAAGDLCNRVVTALQVGQKTVPESKAAVPMPASLEAYRCFIEGRDAAYDLRFSESIEKLTKAVTLDSTFIRAYQLLAWQYETIGDPVKAQEVLAKGRPYVSRLSLEEKLEYLSVEASIERRWKDYAMYLERLLKLRPQDASLHYNYGIVQYFHFRQIDAGIAAMEKSLQLDSTYSNVYNMLGYAYLSKGAKEKAVAMHQEYVARNPADVNPLESLAETLEYIGRYDEAIKYCQRIMAIQPDFRYAPLRLARVFLALGKYTATEEVLEEYLQRDSPPKFQSIGLTIRANLHFLRDELDEALRLVEQATGLYSSNLEAHWLRGLILLRSQKEKGEGDLLGDLLADLRRELERKGSLKDGWLLAHLKGELALQRRDFDGAIESFQEALDFGPLDRSFYLAALANAYEQSGNLSNAVSEYNRALEFNPNNAMASFELARAYERMGKMSEAENAYRNVLQIWSSADETIKELTAARRKVVSKNISSKN